MPLSDKRLGVGAQRWRKHIACRQQWATLNDRHGLVQLGLFSARGLAPCQNLVLCFKNDGHITF